MTVKIAPTGNARDRLNLCLCGHQRIADELCEDHARRGAGGVIMSALAVPHALGQMVLMHVPLCCGDRGRSAALGSIEPVAGYFPASVCLYLSKTARSPALQDG